MRANINGGCRWTKGKKKLSALLGRFCCEYLRERIARNSALSSHFPASPLASPSRTAYRLACEIQADVLIPVLDGSIITQLSFDSVIIESAVWITRRCLERVSQKITLSTRQKKKKKNVSSTSGEVYSPCRSLFPTCRSRIHRPHSSRCETSSTK